MQFQINPFPSRQYECLDAPDENGGSTKQGDNSKKTFKRDLGICILQRDHDYCRVPAGQIGHQGRLGFENCQDSSDWLLSPRVFQDIWVKWRFQEFELFASGAYHQEIPSYLSWKADPQSLATDEFQQSWKHWRLLYAFPPFPMIWKVLLKVKTEELDAILITPS